jgi:hypothetical protein
VITFAEVKASPGWEDAMPNANEPIKNFELALAELIDTYRGRLSKVEVIDSLEGQRDRVNYDWPQPKDVNPEDPEAA